MTFLAKRATNAVVLRDFSHLLLYNLANNPLKQEKAIEEIDKVVGDGKISAEKFAQRRYLKACFFGKHKDDSSN